MPPPWFRPRRPSALVDRVERSAVLRRVIPLTSSLAGLGVFVGRDKYSRKVQEMGQEKKNENRFNEPSALALAEDALLSYPLTYPASSAPLPQKEKCQTMPITFLFRNNKMPHIFQTRGSSVYYNYRCSKVVHAYLVYSLHPYY